MNGIVIHTVGEAWAGDSTAGEFPKAMVEAGIA